MAYHSEPGSKSAVVLLALLELHLDLQGRVKLLDSHP